MALTACPDCDLLLDGIPPKTGEKHQCPRCNAVIAHAHPNSLQRVMACSFAGLIFYPFAITQPLLSLNALGLVQTGHLFQGVEVLYQTGYYFVAIILLLTSIIVPFLELSLLFYLSLMIVLKKKSKLNLWLFRAYHHLEEWGMSEIYMLGILIAIIKLGAIATLTPNIGLLCFVGLMLMVLLSALSLDEDYYWQQLGFNHD